MRKIKKDNVYQKELEEGIKNLKIELEAKSAIFKQAQENEEEIKNLKIELDAKTAIYKEQRDSLNKERILNKELQTNALGKAIDSALGASSVSASTLGTSVNQLPKTGDKSSSLLLLAGFGVMSASGWMLYSELKRKNKGKKI